MRIGLLTDSLDRPGTTGVKTYTENLVRGLLAVDTANQYSFVHGRATDSTPYGGGAQVVVPRSDASWGGFTWRFVTMPRKLGGMEFDLVHDPGDCGPLLFPRAFPFRRVMTVHDMNVLLLPHASNRVSVLVQRVFVRWLKKMDRVITDSHHSKKDIVSYARVAPEKVKVIHLAANEAFRPLEARAVADACHRYGLDFPFILDVAALDAKKNLPALVRAFGRLKQRGLPHKLVIVGGRRWGRYEDLSRTIEQEGLSRDVVILSFVPLEDLVALYNAADLFAFPSLYEGFGLPVLEAMACGTPVVASNTASLPEVVGDAGITVNPHDVAALADAMEEVLTNASLRDSLVERGFEWSGRFSWQRCARETIEVYEQVVRGGG